MKSKNKIFTLLTLVLAVVIFGLVGCGQQKTVGEDAKIIDVAMESPDKMVDCGQAEDPGCFINRMVGCLPVTTKMIGSDNKTAIEITILGVENEKCHFQRKLNNVMDLNCFFPKGTLNSDTFNQMFGNDKGLQKVVDEACKYPTDNPGW